LQHMSKYEHLPWKSPTKLTDWYLASYREGAYMCVWGHTVQSSWVSSTQCGSPLQDMCNCRR
jgi:hypothetical protein